MSERAHAARFSDSAPVSVTLLGAVAIAWLALGHYLPGLLWHGLPRRWLDALTLPAYNMICQVVTTVLGASWVWFWFRNPCAVLGLARPTPASVLATELLAPLVFVVASCVALGIAEPYLLDELARQGAGASRKNAGAFGKAVTEAPLAMTLLWGAVLAAVSEELMFRGALFSAVERLALLIGSPPAAHAERMAGWAAVVLSAATFGAMHADMNGSVGIVRVVATTCLGLACGTARWLGKTVVVSMLLHFTYNTISVGVGRGWFQGTSEPLVLVVPNRLVAIAVGGAILAIALATQRSLRRRRTHGEIS